MNIASIITPIIEFTGEKYNHVIFRPHPPKKGKEYTLREIKKFDNDIIGIKIEEITVIDKQDGKEWSFHLNYWRELLPPLNAQELVKECFTIKK